MMDHLSRIQFAVPQIQITFFQLQFALLESESHFFSRIRIAFHKRHRSQGEECTRVSKFVAFVKYCANLFIRLTPEDVCRQEYLQTFRPCTPIHDDTSSIHSTSHLLFIG